MSRPSCIILSTRARVSGKRKISIIVAFADRADRIDRQIAQGFPPDFGANVAERARLQAGFHERRVDGRTRSLSEPSISPMGRRLLPIWRTTPGSGTSPLARANAP
ncbi:MAG TPA: hypothetical protein VIG52_05865 [Methyloceanibacter sp.]